MPFPLFVRFFRTATRRALSLLRDSINSQKKTKNQKKRKPIPSQSGKKSYGKHGGVKIKTRYSKKPPSRLATSILYPTSTKVINIRRNFETDSLVDVLKKDKNSFAGFQRQTFGNSPKPTVQVAYTRGDYTDFGDDNIVSEDRHNDGNTITTYDANNNKNTMTGGGGVDGAIHNNNNNNTITQ